MTSKNTFNLFKSLSLDINTTALLCLMHLRLPTILLRGGGLYTFPRTQVLREEAGAAVYGDHGHGVQGHLGQARLRLGGVEGGQGEADTCSSL